MHLLKKSAVLFLVCFLSLSCELTEDDDSYDPPGPDGILVEYRVTASTGMITKVRYHTRLENLETVTLGNHPAEWSKAMHAPPPFDALLQVDFNNTTASPQNYTLEIFVEDELAASASGFLASNNSTTGTVSFHLDF